MRRQPQDHCARLVAAAAIAIAAMRGHGDAAAFELDADRDAFTPSAFCVDAGQGLVEGSYVFIDNQTGLPTNNYPELLVRQRANEWLEWRFGVNYGVGSQGNVVTSVEVSRLGPRWRLAARRRNPLRLLRGRHQLVQPLEPFGRVAGARDRALGGTRRMVRLLYPGARR